MKTFFISIILVLSFTLMGLANEKVMPERPIDLPMEKTYYSFLPPNDSHPLLLMCYKKYLMDRCYEEIWVVFPDKKEWYFPSQFPRYYFYDFNDDDKMQDSEVLWDEIEDGRNGNEIWLDTVEK